jgi:multimeric flavodoxin WrbA
MKLLAINGSPRKTMNTALLLEKIVEGAASRGAQTQLVHLYGLRYTGCVSCFKCKLVGGENYGRCAVRDALTPVLQAAHEAEVVILGSPVYFFSESGMMRSFMERFMFQYFLYTTKKPPLSPPKKATALVYTMNLKEQEIAIRGMNYPIAASRMFMERVFGRCELFMCTDTKQMDDYSKYEMDYFDTAAKDKRHAEIFPRELQRAFDFGAQLAL